MNKSTMLPGIGRDRRLDVFRGLALLTIFINHVPGNVFENFTSRNFGFSDAAEAFVLMSGIAVGLAYSRGFQAGEWSKAILRVLRRAGTLYVAHIVTSVIAIAIIAFGVVYLNSDKIVPNVNFGVMLEKPLEAVIGLPVLGYQIGYFNILPLYCTLLIVSPLYIFIGIRSRTALIAFATAIWILAGTFRLNLPNYPIAGGWFFNPVSWQLLYAIGVAAGLAALEKRKLVPFKPWLFGLSFAYLVFSMIWIQMKMGALPLDRSLPFYLASFDKTFLSLPRLLHVLALAYVLTNLSIVSRLIAMPAFKPIELIGQHSLAVFATGSVLSIALQVYRARFQTGVLEDGILLLSGILVQYGLARFLAATSEKKRGEKAGAVEAGEPVIIGRMIEQPLSS